MLFNNSNMVPSVLTHQQPYMFQSTRPKPVKLMASGHTQLNNYLHYIRVINTSFTLTDYSVLTGQAGQEWLNVGESGGIQEVGVSKYNIVLWMGCGGGRGRRRKRKSWR